MRYLLKNLFLGMLILVVLFLTHITPAWAPDGTRPHPGREAPAGKPTQPTGVSPEERTKEAMGVRGTLTINLISPREIYTNTPQISVSYNLSLSSPLNVRTIPVKVALFLDNQLKNTTEINNFPNGETRRLFISTPAPNQAREYVVTLKAVRADVSDVSLARSEEIYATATQRIRVNEALSIFDFSATTPHPDLALGDEETFKWDIRGYNIKNLRLEITPDVGAIPLTRTDYIGEEFKIVNARKVRPSISGSYTLRVTGDEIGLGGTISHIEKTKSILVRVRRPKLENVQPEVNERNKDAIVISFYAKNTGEAEFRPTPITVNYRIEGRRGTSASAILEEGSHTTSELGIKRGEQVGLGRRISLPDRKKVLSYDELHITVRIGANYVLPLESDEDTFIYRWKYPDLIVSSVRFEEIKHDRIEGSAGWTERWVYNAIITVKNEGGASAGPFKVSMRRKDGIEHKGDVSGLAGGQETTISFKIEMHDVYYKRTGERKNEWNTQNLFTVKVDSGDNVEESFEENNIVKTTIPRPIGE
jgi:hypothetical protein